MLDILIQNGYIVDGSGRPGYYADLAVKGSKIVKIAPGIREPAGRVIDAGKKTVAPGFIDCHNHSESGALLGSQCYNFLEQGITTQITGQCGVSAAPYYPGAMLTLKRLLSEEQFSLLTGKSQTAQGYFAALEQVAIGNNMAVFAGHNNLRGKIMGDSAAAPTAAQLYRMREELARAVEAGCLGLSTGLVYTPSAYATTEELIQLVKVLQPYGGIYATHVRGEGSHVVEAVKEAIRIGEETGVQVQLSHLKVIGRSNEGLSEQLLRLIDDANARGVCVYADQYPYTASSASLRSRIPPKYHKNGVQALLEMLKDPQARKQIEYSVFYETQEFESSLYAAGYEGSVLAYLPETPELTGKTLAQLGRETGKAPMDAFCDTLLANNGVGQGIFFNQNEQDMRRILSHPRVFGGSDASNYPDVRYAPTEKTGRHPRGVATMVRRLELQRDGKLCSQEEAIRRITGAPAEAFGLRGQGFVKEGCDASLVVLDYPKLRANATYEQPCLPNEGIDYVLVNGVVAVENGISTGARAGKVLKRV